MGQSCLFLASQSPRRAELLHQWGVPFEVIENRLLTESLPESGSLSQLRKRLRRLATLKARASGAGYSGIVLGADTIVVHRRRVLGKPRDLKEAAFMLSCLSDSWHQVLSGVCLWDTRTRLLRSFCVGAGVRFRTLSSAQIEAYISDYEVLDKAGGYAIQDIGNEFVSQVRGSYSTVVGLPEYPLKYYLRQWGVSTR